MISKTIGCRGTLFSDKLIWPAARPRQADVRDASRAARALWPSRVWFDTRIEGKPEMFKGDPNEFLDWCFIFRFCNECGIQ